MLRNARLGLGELCEEHGSWFLGSCAPEREGLPEGACCVLGARSGAAAFSCALRGRGVGWRSAGLSICPVQGRRSVSLSVPCCQVPTHATLLPHISCVSLPVPLVPSLVTGVLRATPAPSLGLSSVQKIFVFPHLLH